MGTFGKSAQYPVPTSYPVTRRFDSFDAFLEAAHGDRITSRSSSYMLQTDRYSADWTGTRDIDQAEDLARNGDTAREEKVRAASSRIGSLCSTMGARALQFTDRWDVAGDEPDIDRYLTGEPENMRTSELIEVSRGGRILQFVQDLWISAGTSARAIETVGAALAALVDIAESAGYRVEVIASFSSKYHNTDVQIKDSGDALDWTRLVYACVNPSMLRRHIFGLQETESDEVLNRCGFNGGSSGGGGHGGGGKLSMSQLKERFPEASLIVPGIALGEPGESEEKAALWVVEQARAMGLLEEE